METSCTRQYETVLTLCYANCLTGKPCLSCVALSVCCTTYISHDFFGGWHQRHHGVGEYCEQQAAGQ